MDPLKTSMMPVTRMDAGPAKGAREEKQASAPQDSVSLRQGEEAPKKKWTVLLYSAADNNLQSYMVDDVKELERVGSDANTNLAAQVDRGGDIGCKRYFLEKHSSLEQSGGIASPVLADLGSTDMASPGNLADFIKWGVKNYPAEHYMLVISDHGDAWNGACEDDSHGTWMDMGKIKEGISTAQNETGVKLDIIGFDACLMANTEVGYQLKDLGGYLVGSEQTEGADGWPYQKILDGKELKEFQRMLRKKVDIAPDELAKKVVSKAADTQGVLPTMSATDLSQMKSLAGATDTFAQSILDTATPNAQLKDIARATQSFYGYKDYYDFAERITKSADITDEALKTSAQGLMDAIKTAVIAEQHASKFPGAHGLTIEIPTWGSSGEKYGKLDFTKDTKWDEAMNKITS